MDRYDPFEEMDRMFEQLRTRMWTPERSLGGERRLGDGREMSRRGTRTPRRETSRRPRRETSRSEMSRSEMSRPEGEGVSMDLNKRGDEFVFVADLPGFEREDVDLSFEDGVLTLDAESETREEQTGGEGDVAIRGEFTSVRRISERVTMPEEVREDEIDASFRNGVLEVHLPLVNSEERDDGGKKIDIGE